MSGSDNCCLCNAIPKVDSCSFPPVVCKRPAKLDGLDVEIAIRKEPFLKYPPHKLKKSSKSKQKKSARQSNYIPPPHCTPRYYLKRIYQLILKSARTGKSVSTDVWTCWNLYESYEKEAGDVFVYNDVDVTANLILLLSLNCRNLQQYKGLFDKMMQRLQSGIYFTTASKEHKDIRKLTYFFSCLGIAIVDGQSQAQTRLSGILFTWLEKLVTKNNHVETTTCIANQFLKHSIKAPKGRIPEYLLLTALEKSFLSTTIAKRLGSEAEIESYLSMISLLTLCCKASLIIREQLLCCTILDDVFSRLSHPDPSNRILVKSIDLVYCIFGIYDVGQEEDRFTDRIPKVHKLAFQTLLERFIQQVKTPNYPSKSLLSIRNDTAFMIFLVCERVPYVGEYFQSHGMTIASMVKNTILGIKDSENSLFLNMEASRDDIELVQLMISMLRFIIENGRGAKLIREYSLVSVLLQIFQDPVEEIGLRRTDLYITAWYAMHAIAQQSSMFLLRQTGDSPYNILTVLQTFGSFGEGSITCLAVSLSALNTLLATTTASTFTGSDGSKQEENESSLSEVIYYLIERKAMAILISVLNRLIYENCGEGQDTMISNALFSCAALGHHSVYQKGEFVDLGGAILLSMLMRNLIEALGKNDTDTAIQISIAECISGCIAYYPKSLEKFLECEGIFRVLDLLEIATDPEAIVQLTNCVVQVTEYPRCLDQMLCWKRPGMNNTKRYVFGTDIDSTAKSELYTTKEAPKSGDNLMDLERNRDTSLGAMLCSLWKNEEQRIKVLRDPDSCIASLACPLMSDKDRATEWEAKTSTTDQSNASLRPKIYLLVKHILEMTNTMSTVCDGLSLINQIALQLIINFLDLKKAEVFTSLMHEIESHGKSFAPPDEEKAKRVVSKANNVIATVLETQRFLVRTHKERECMKETEYYDLLRQCYLQDHLQAVREVDYFARTTNYQYLVERRLWQKTELDHSLKHIDLEALEYSRIHRTLDNFLNITTLTTLPKTIEADPEIDNNEPGAYEENGYSSDNEKEKAKRHSTKHSIFSVMTTASSSNFIFTTPDSEGGFYQVSPYPLHKALDKLRSLKICKPWLRQSNQDEENEWKIHKKWKQDWYP